MNDTKLKRSEDLIHHLRATTNARIFVGQTGSSLKTSSYLSLRADHAAARDSVWDEVDLVRDFGTEFMQRFDIRSIASCAADKAVFLRQPELGRKISAEFCDAMVADSQPGNMQIIIGDGLSAAAVRNQVPQLLPELIQELEIAGFKLNPIYFVRHCRVGILNHFGELAKPAVAILLIGERPGLGAHDSLSIYFSYQPQQGQTDADRNLIANIHAKGVAPHDAAHRSLALVRQLLDLKKSGFEIKESLSQAIEN